MNRNEYLQDADVREFTKWATKLVTGKWGLSHSWHGKQSDCLCFNFECKSLYDAYTSYYWKGNFEKTADLMAGFRREFQDAITDGDKSSFLQTAKKVMV